MIPSTILGALVLLAVIAPGYSYIRIAERRSLRPVRSRLLETTELAVVGLTSTVITAAGLLLVAEVWGGPLVELDEWAAHGNQYVVDEANAAAVSFGTVVVGSFLIGACLGWITHRRLPKSIDPAGNVWSRVLVGTGNDDVWVSVLFRDGRVIEGYMLVHPNEAEEQHEFALQAPIFYWHEGSRQRLPHTDAAIVRTDEVVTIGVRYEKHRGVPERTGQS